MSTTTPPLALGSIFLVEESFFTIPSLHWGVLFLLKKKVSSYNNPHEFYKYVRVKIMYKIKIEPPLVVLAVAPTFFTKINNS